MYDARPHASVSTYLVGLVVQPAHSLQRGPLCTAPPPLSPWLAQLNNPAARRCHVATLDTRTPPPDQLGFQDVGWRENTDVKDATPFITSLARDGILLESHCEHRRF